jgi:ferric iron reductase protein FhuF
MHDKGVLNSPNYLKEKGKPVISLWGMLYLSLAFVHLLNAVIMQASALRTQTITQPASVP